MFSNLPKVREGHQTTESVSIHAAAVRAIYQTTDCHARGIVVPVCCGDTPWFSAGRFHGAMRTALTTLASGQEREPPTMSPQQVPHTTTGLRAEGERRSIVGLRRRGASPSPIPTRSGLLPNRKTAERAFAAATAPNRASPYPQPTR